MDVGSATRERGGRMKPEEPTTTMTHDELKKAFLQGGERDAQLAKTNRQRKVLEREERHVGALGCGGAFVGRERI